MLTLRPRAARSVSLPRLGRAGNTLTRGQSRVAGGRQGERPPLWIVLSAVLVTLFELLPLLYLVARTLNAGEIGWRVMLRSRTLEVVLNTAVLAGAVAISTITIAVPLAWLTSRTDLPGRAFWSAAAPRLLVIPSYVCALVVAAFRPRGMLQSALVPFGVERLPSNYGFTGSWLTLTLFTYPYVYLTVRAALGNLDPSLEEAAAVSATVPGGPSWRSPCRRFVRRPRPAAY